MKVEVNFKGVPIMFAIIKAVLEKDGVPGWLVEAFYGGLREAEAEGMPMLAYPEPEYLSRYMGV